MLADPPPAIVREAKGYHYHTGRKLGNGGFAIAYSAEVHQGAKPTGKIVALKIVRNQKDKRIIQKVNKKVLSYVRSCFLEKYLANFGWNTIVRIRASITFEAAPPQYCRVLPRILVRG